MAPATAEEEAAVNVALARRIAAAAAVTPQQLAPWQSLLHYLGQAEEALDVLEDRAAAREACAAAAATLGTVALLTAAALRAVLARGRARRP